MFRNCKKKNARQVILLTLALSVIIILAVTARTLAWIRYDRQLVTYTKIQYDSMNLEVADVSGFPVELGEIDIRNRGSKSIPFVVQSKPRAKYLLQIGHTTNLPLTYKISHLYVAENGEITPGTAVDGDYLKQNLETNEETDDVQKNANPLYWQSEALTCSNAGLDYYVLEVSWPGRISPELNKETEMIYLTAGLGGRILNGTPTTETP